MRRSFLLVAVTVFNCGGAPAGGDASPDVIGTDATADQGGAGDSGTDGAGACNAAAVAFPRGGTLAPGTLCDELYACADDAAGAARIEVASPRFQCTPGAEPESTCTVFTCAFRNPGGPSTLDASEIADICALTLLSPTPTLRCVVFVLAP
jgi:hypothetical protein